MKTLLGLGNPGHTYHDTRHNVGFMVIQQLIERHRVDLRERLVSPLDQRPSAVRGEGRIGSESMQLVMPLTMMNESGEALRTLGVEPRELLIVCDDVNLLLGTIRVRGEGGAGGHHGLESCLAVLGTEGVARLRIGVGIRAGPRDLRGFVLSPFGSDERPAVQRVVAQAADACELWVTDGIEAAMNRYNKAQDA